MPRLLVSAELVQRRSLRREQPPVRIVGTMGAAENVEGLLEIAVVGQRAAIAGEQRLLPGWAMVACSSTATACDRCPAERSAFPYFSAASASFGLAR